MKHRDDIDADFAPSIITGKAAERYFELQATLFEFSRLFNYDERNDRAIAIVGATFLETILEHILRAFLIDNEKEVDKLLQYDQPLGTFRTTISRTTSRGATIECGFKNKARRHLNQDRPSSSPVNRRSATMGNCRELPGVETPG